MTGLCRSFFPRPLPMAGHQSAFPTLGHTNPSPDPNKPNLGLSGGLQTYLRMPR